MLAIDTERFKRIDVPKLVPVLQHEQLWYSQGPVSELINELFSDPSVDEDREGYAKKQEFMTLVGALLRRKQVFLGDRPEGFNDDDRWGGRFNPASTLNNPDTVVIHHTVTSGFVSFDKLDALGLLRLYVPLYRGTVFGKDQPISSGHFKGNRQIFVGYHDLIYPNGAHTRALLGDYTGFHAGDYPTNCRSYGVSFVGDYSHKSPSKAALETGRLIIAEYSPKQVIGHREVVRKDGQFVDTICPGNLFLGDSGWKQEFLKSLH